ncbi:hypothetical protein ACGGZK_17970 [Agromyces sp. MMS24-K17]|uniref:hypothetical protein n=1 Tax=Agromyces sp. MMS24-K17 TaxID=3372850 RepID=UPI003754900E
MPADPPVEEQRPAEVRGGRPLPGVEQVPHDRAQVVGVVREALHPGELRGALEGELGLLAEGEVPSGVAVVHRAGVGQLLEVLVGDLAHGAEQVVDGPLAALLLPHDARVDEGLEVGDHLAVAARGDRLGGLEREGAGEHAEPGEQALRALGHELHAPLDRAAHGAVPFGQVARAVGEQRQAPVEPFEQLGRRQHAGTRGGQLDRERHAVEGHAHPGDVDGVLGGELEVGLHGPHAVDEEPHRRGLQLAGPVDDARGIGQGQRPELDAVLARDAQQAPAGDEHRDLGQLLEEVAEHRARADDLLEVVDEQEHPPPAQCDAHLVCEAAVAGVVEAHGGGDRGGHALGVGHGREVDERDAVGEVVVHRDGDDEPEEALADARRAGDGDEPGGAAQQADDGGELALPADHLRQGHGRRRDVPALDGDHGGAALLVGTAVEAFGEEGREVAADELGELLLVGEVDVGGAVVVADPAQELGEPRFAVGHVLDVHELRHVAPCEAPLVLEAGDLLPGATQP